MRKMTIADKLAKKSFDSPKFQQSWAVHMHSFGPILEPAFEENYPAKVHLTAALNLISSRQLAQGFDKLKQLQKFCETDADKTAFLFFMGVCFEMMGDQENMMDFYCAANEYGHSFYLPYIKVGKSYLSDHAYAPACENFRAAIDCFTAAGLDDQDRRILGSAYTNLATCLLMMHRYDEAQAALTTSRDLCPEAPGRSAVEAPLYALQGDGFSGCLPRFPEGLFPGSLRIRDCHRKRNSCRNRSQILCAACGAGADCVLLGLVSGIQRRNAQAAAGAEV